MRKIALFALLALGSIPAQAGQPKKGWIKIHQLTPTQGIYVRVLEVSGNTRKADFLIEGNSIDTLIFNCKDWTFVNAQNPSKVIPIEEKSWDALTAAAVCR